jgi:aminoglycoside phosphotransferase (APT) family kinase protein
MAAGRDQPSSGCDVVFRDAQQDAPHGFVLDAEDERLLRGPVPGRALAWPARAVGYGARVVRSRPLAGGTSSAVHALTMSTAGGQTCELVLRRFVRSDWLAEEPDLARREATALETAGRCPVPTPRLVAVDEEGGEVGEPAVLMTRLPGAVIWDSVDVESFLRTLGEILPAVHATPVSPRLALPDYAPYRVRMRRAPRWADRPDVWSKGVELLDGPAPGEERRFIHRDYHPGNVLWQRGRLVGVVDWVNASIGSPWADVGHCRVNLASELGQDAADRFLELYRVAAGRADDYHPYWDISAAIGGLDEDADGAPSPADERFLAAAVARL